MKRQLSRSDFSTTFGFFMLSMKRTLGVTVLLCAFALLICPCYSLMSIHRDLQNSTETVFRFYDTATATAIGTAVLSSIAAVFYLFLNFHFLYSRKASDFFYALPIKRRDMLLARYFASVVPVLLPVLLVYGSMLAMLLSPHIAGGAAAILIGLLYNIVLILLTTAFTLIFLLAASNTVDFLVSFFTFHFGVVFLQIMLEELSSRYLRGYAGNNVVPFYWINPIFFSFEGMGTDLDIAGESPSLSSSPLIILILALLFLAVSLFLNQKRKSEKSGTGTAFRFVYSLCTFLVGLLGGFLTGFVFSGTAFDFPYWFFSAIGGVLATVAYGAILNRGFKTVKHSVLLGVISWVAAITLTLSFAFDIYGFTARIPKAQEIKSAQISFSHMERVTFKNPEAVLTLHKKAIPTPETDDDLWYLELHYDMKNGTKMERDFSIAPADCMDELLALYKSEENRDSIREAAESYYGDSVDFVLDTFSEKKPDSLPTDGSLTKMQLSSLMEAFLKDLDNATEESFLQEKDTVTVSLSGLTTDGEYLDVSLVVESGFKNTRAFLAEFAMIPA